MSDFKVGDWIRVYNIIESSEYLSLIMEEEVIRGKIVQTDKYRNLLNSSYLTVESWQPTEGEWCCVVHHGDLNTFVVFQWNKKYKGTSMECCEPFIGELPSFIKDN